MQALKQATGRAISFALAVCRGIKEVLFVNRKIVKLRDEQEKIKAKISELQARSREIDGQVTAIENTDIIGLVRDSGMTMEQFAEMMQAMKKAPAPVFPDNTTAKITDTEDITDEN